jgi:integrase
LAGGRCLPAVDTGITVAELARAYWKFAQGYYRKDGQPTGTIHRVRVAVRTLRKTYGHTLAREFGPLSLQAVQSQLAETDKSRSYVNSLVDVMRRLFKWGVAQEIVPESVYRALCAVNGLRKGPTAAREEPIRPVATTVVEATVLYMPLIVADMVRFQQFTGCRPGEVCIIRPCDVDTSGGVRAYSTQAMDMTIPVEEDLLSALRTIAEHGKGLFPAKLGMNKEFMEAAMAGGSPEMDKLAGEKIEAEMNKVAAKYGGKDKLRAKYGKDIPPAIMAEIMKATTPLIQEQTQKQMPLMQKRMRGITFYMMLKPENDSHYVGGGVKLGTPDCPILWYKPTGADKYRVIYADLSVKDMMPDDVKKLPEAKAKEGARRGTEGRWSTRRVALS